MGNGMIKSVLLVMVVCSFARCSQEGNVADCDNPNKGTIADQVPCEAKTDDEKALIALNAGEFDEAIVLLSPLIAQTPTEYFRHPILAAAYAAKAQVKILNLFQSSLGSDGSVFELLGGFLPDAEARGAVYDQDLSNMQQAIDTLLRVPEADRLNTEQTFAKSIQLQLQLYQTAFPVMLLNKHVKTSSENPEEIDAEALEEMTDEEADAIIESLEVAARDDAGGDPALNAKIDEVLAALETQPGASNRERLIAYTQSQNQSGEGGD